MNEDIGNIGNLKERKEVFDVVDVSRSLFSSTKSTSFDIIKHITVERNKYGNANTLYA